MQTVFSCSDPSNCSIYLSAASAKQQEKEANLFRSNSWGFRVTDAGIKKKGRLDLS